MLDLTEDEFSDFFTALGLLGYAFCKADQQVKLVETGDFTMAVLDLFGQKFKLHTRHAEKKFLEAIHRDMPADEAYMLAIEHLKRDKVLIFEYRDELMDMMLSVAKADKEFHAEEHKMFHRLDDDLKHLHRD